mgnify:CR=1 FL=1
MELYNLKTEKILSLQGHTKAVAGVAFSPDNKTLASTGGDYQVKIWDLASGKEVRSFDNSPFDHTLYFSFTEDEKWLVSASTEMKATNYVNGNIICWDTSNWQKKRTIPYNKLRIAGAIVAHYYNPIFAMNSTW